MRILAIDPGTHKSAWIIYETETRRPLCWDMYPNENVLDAITFAASAMETALQSDACVIEMVGHYGTGMPAGKDVFTTCIWIGRFVESWIRQNPDATIDYSLQRQTIKAHLCGSARATDANVRQAIIDRYGGKDEAIGRKANPGVLYGIKQDVWQALALAIVWSELPRRDGT